MATAQDDEKSRKKLIQLRDNIRSVWNQSSNYSDKSIVNNILKEDFNVNYKIVENKKRVSKFDHNPFLYNMYPIEQCTALHILASAAYDIDMLDNLLERGADFTVKNENGQTALHQLIAPIDRPIQRMNAVAPFINSILSAHIKFNISINPRDNNELSHFHAACMANHVEAVTFFLDNGVTVNEAVDLEIPYYAGYTPLHFAAHFASFETVEILINRGANIDAKDARGMSFIDVLVQRRLQESLDWNDRFLVRDILKMFPVNEKIIKSLLNKQLCPSAVGLSTLQVACTLEDLSIAESLLKQVDDINYAVPSESSTWAGYTAAHFAALNRVDAVKMLATHGAKLDIEDANGFTPLDACAKNGYSVRDFHDILLCVEDFRETCLSDGKTKLLDLVLSMTDVNQFKMFLDKNPRDLAVSSDSKLWPCSTILHLAVILSTNHSKLLWAHTYDVIIVKECLVRGHDVNARNCRGQTTLNLAFRLGKRNIIKLLLSHFNGLDRLINHIDEDDLSHLHIACSVYSDRRVVEKLLESSEPNVAYKGKRIFHQMRVQLGWTPLHMAVASHSHINAKVLLRQGANLHSADIYGLTPIHWLLKHYIANNSSIPEIVTVLFESLLANPEDRVVDDLGLSYLHVACVYAQTKAVEKLIDIGSNINAVVNFQKASHYSNRLLPSKLLSYLAKYSTFTPLHCATLFSNPATLDVLLRRGADVFAKFSNSPDSCILLEKMDIARRFVPFLWDNREMQLLAEKQFGITKLHVACYMKNEEAIRHSLNEGFDVNAQILKDSVIFAGCTPLHLLMTVSQSKFGWDGHHLIVNGMINLLLDHGADVTIRNAEEKTPIHLFYKCVFLFDDRALCRDSLMNAHRDFSINPTNEEGMSHFHLACSWQQVNVVEKFLQHGSVDVNRPNDSGSTPLHLVLLYERNGVENDWEKRSQIVDLLVENGANVNAEDVNGDTPLHGEAVLSAAGISVLEKLVSYGADVRIENVKGETPMEKWSFTDMDDYTRIFRKIGFGMNFWNRLTGQGYIAKLFLSQDLGDIAQNSAFNNWLQSSDALVVDEMGRTAMHNAVANFCHVERLDNHFYAIENFMKLGIDIDHQDKAGKTALHYAAHTRNHLGLKALLKCGADMNIVDNSGKPAYSYPMEDVKSNNIGPQSVIGILHEHVQKLQYLGLEVSECNRYLADETQKLRNLEAKISETFLNQIEITKTLNVGIGSMTLFDFLCETGAVSLYPFLLESTQGQIDNFFKSIDFKELEEVDGIIKLQFRKMKARLELINSALYSLKTLLSFSFPGLCEEITRFLTNTDLKNLIASIKVVDDAKESSENYKTLLTSSSSGKK